MSLEQSGEAAGEAGEFILKLSPIIKLSEVFVEASQESSEEAGEPFENTR
jgi:hypothetical protein